MVRGHKLSHRRAHHFAPAPATENAVVPSAHHVQMLCTLAVNASAQIMRRTGLARARNIVQFAFYGKHGNAGDVLRLHPLKHT